MADPDRALTILVIEDDAAHGKAVAEGLSRSGHRVSVATSGTEGLRRVASDDPDLVVTDLRLQDLDGMQVVAKCRELRGDRATPQCIVVTGFGTVEGAVQAMAAGALNFLQKPVDLPVLRQTVMAVAERIALERTNRELRSTLDKTFAFPGIVGQTPAMARVLDVLRQVGDTDATVLVLGESGTGKELVAQAIHEMSPRRARPFVVVECASLPETLFESELFGHEKGAFTGASSAKPGLVESADGGTLFLDEVGDIPLSMQVKLLRLLESGCYRRVGGNDLRHTDVRVISATHRDLRRMVADGGFRQDLFFRLATFPIRIPPLRERLEDIELLAMALLRRMGEGRELALTPGALDRLRRHDYPGNVRELRNILERAMLMADGTRIGEPHMRHAMDDSVWTIGTAFERRADAPQAGDADGEAAGTLKALEAEALRAALAAHRGDRRSLAKKLGISERTLYRRLRARGPG